jgi:hypothetical protein
MPAFTTMVAMCFVALVSGAQDSRAADRLIAVIPDGVVLSGPPETDPNGKTQTPVSEVVFRRDGGQVAYIGFKGGRSCPVIGASVGEPFDYLDTPIFGGEHVFFRAGNRTSSTTEKWWIYADGKKTAAEDWIGAIACNADGSELAYWIQPGAKIEPSGIYSRSNLSLVVGKRKGAKWSDAESLAGPLYSPAGDRVATAAMKGSRWQVLLASQKSEELRGPGYGLIAGIAWRPDGKEVAYAAVTSDARGPRPPALGLPAGAGLSVKYVIVYGKDVFGAKYDSAGTPAFSPDGKRLAFKVLKGTKLGVASSDDDAVEPRFDFVSRPVFSSKGGQLAYAACVGVQVDPWTAVTEDGDPEIEGGEWFVMVGKTKSAVFERVGRPVFSPDGTAVAHAARLRGKWHVVAGKKTSPAFDQVGTPQFSPDGRQVSFGAVLGRELWWKVMHVD